MQKEPIVTWTQQLE